MYEYKISGAKVAAEALGVHPNAMIKTLIMEDNSGEPFFILMHGDKDVSTKELAREIGSKSVSTCSRRNAERYTGFKVGGISPFGIKRELPVYIEETILNLPRLYINAGRRGFLIEMTPKELVRILKPTPVNVAR